MTYDADVAWPDPEIRVEEGLGNYRAVCNCGWHGPLRAFSSVAQDDADEGHEHQRIWSLDLRPADRKDV